MANYKYTLEVLTPLHIGSGQKLYPIEYITDGQYLIRVDMDLFLRSMNDEERERFRNESKRDGFSLASFNRAKALKAEKYKIKIDPSYDFLREVLEFIKEGGKFYIPGSSIKGAIRTALLWKMTIINNTWKNNYEKELREALQKGKKKESFSVDAEQTLLGEPNYSILRILQIGDSDPVEPSEVEVVIVKVFNSSKKFSIFLEVLKQGAKLSGSLKRDDFLLRDDVASTLNLNATDLIKEIANTCNKFSLSHLDKEIEFYKKAKEPTLRREMERIKGTPLSENEFLLHLAWGTGYEAKALGNTIDRGLFNNIRKTLRIGKDPQSFPEYPITRKIIIQNNKPVTVPGWVKISLLKE